MMIYAEWKLDDVFDNGLFDSWEAFHAATFSPDIDITLVRVIH